MKLLHLIPLALLLLSCSSTDNLYSGTIETDEVRISARVGGAVVQRPVTSGDQIQEGQILIILDQTEYLLALAQTDASLEIARANLETLIQGTREQQIISALSSAEAAGTAKNLARADLARAEELAAAGAISEQALQWAETAAAQAEAQYTAAWQSYSLAAEGVRSTEIQAAEAAVEAATATRDIAANRLEWTTVTSPLTGVVTGTSVQQGENISAGYTLLTVADMDTVKAIFYVSQPGLADISAGQPVSVSVNSAETAALLEVTGTITHIADQAEFTPSSVETREGRTSLVYRIEASLPNPDGIFKAGMPVDVQLNFQ